ncbi:MAG: YjbH domain-containing protein, partial [Alphaproteobacteria bacterium]
MVDIVRQRGGAVDVLARQCPGARQRPGVWARVTAAWCDRRHGVGRVALRRRVLRRGMLAVAVALAIAPAGTAQGRHTTYTPSVSDYGGVGLLQTRNARFGDEGLFTVGISVVDPYHRYFFSVHGLKGVEAGFRYTTIQNRDILRFGEDIRNTEFQDKGADIKLLLLDETRWRPAVAIGLQDVIGTAQFAGEYIVASKRYYDFDFSVGLGWGRLGQRGHFKNPLTLLSGSFTSRGRSRGGEGGTVDLGQFFAGERVALFGGIEWLTPLEGLRVKIEYDPNTYQNEPLDNRLKVNSAINVGLAYQPFSWLDIGLGFERGNTLQLRVAMTPNVIDPKPVLRIDTPPPPVAPRNLPRPPARTPPAGEPATTAKQTADRLFDGLAEIGLTFESLDIEGPEVTLRVSGEGPIDRAAAARTALRALPPPVDAVTVAVTLPDGTTDATRYPNGTFELAQALGVAPDDLITAQGAPWSEAERRTAAAAITARLEEEAYAVDAVDVEETAVVVFVGQDKY